VATLRSFSATEASLEVMASTAVAVEVGLTNHAQHTLNASDAGPLAKQLLAAWQKS
jgi:hypothetical protein